MSGVNPWEVLALRRRIKGYASLGVPETMKSLQKLRSLGLTKQMIVSTEVTRTLVWACNRTQDPEQAEDVRKLNVMLRYLIKEYKRVLSVSNAMVLD